MQLGGERHCESVLPKNITQCPRPGLEPGTLAPETSTLTMRPLSLPGSTDKPRRNKGADDLGRWSPTQDYEKSSQIFSRYAVRTVVYKSTLKYYL